MGRMTLLGAGATSAAAPASGFVALASASVLSPGVATFTANCTGTLAAGAVAVAAVFNENANVTNFRDNVDAGTAWTSFGDVGTGAGHMRLYKRIVPAGGFNTSTVFTATNSNAGFGGGGIVVAGFADATAIPTTNDSTAAQTAGTSVSVSVTGPTVGTSYQFAAIYASTTGAAGPASGSDASWTLDRSLADGNSGYGMHTYWRKASGTGSTTLNENEGGFSNILAGWMEAAL